MRPAANLVVAAVHKNGNVFCSDAWTQTTLVPVCVYVCMCLCWGEKSHKTLSSFFRYVLSVFVIWPASGWIGSAVIGSLKWDCCFFFRGAFDGVCDAENAGNHKKICSIER